jgi:glucose/arabinose dehydrogenase
MPRRLTPLLLSAAVLAVSATAADAAQLQTAVTGLAEPTYVTSEPGDASRLYAVERTGDVRLVRCGTTPEPRPFLSLGDAVDHSYQEEGLLSLAFAPDYATSGLFYVAYTAPALSGNDLVVEERRRSLGDPFVADPAYAREIVRIPHPSHQNHDGGQLQFGPDGRLWLGTGDGGGSNDPSGNAQNRASLLGKMLRLDLAGGPPEQWAYGLRNPWRFSFDRATGDLVIADVGQNAQEEIDFAPAPARGQGANYGWDVMEGNQGDASGLESYHPPAITHSHASGWVSITGGYVVRDPALPELNGRYVYADYGLGQVHSADLAARQTVNTGLRAEAISSFGEDASGRVYVVSLGEGRVHRLVPDGTGTAGAGGSDCGQPAGTPGDGSTGTPPAAGRGLTAVPGDTAAPVLRLRTARRQRAVRRRAVLVRGSCSEACRLTVTARAAARRLRGRRATLAANRRFALKLTLSRSARRSLRRSLRRGTTRTVVVRFRAGDGSGNVRRRTLKVRVVG